eukprot:TRINITY_DN9994_c0_g1_i1.p1 TRINITY_DN9994_c0_g1~~TRINITY_DN9994_c0_g1_i1.p1  ORF type:complete len:439 (+),score=64.06 TRINITY_DN9994_c0_g1_i1:40-1356(+)
MDNTGQSGNDLTATSYYTFFGVLSIISVVLYAFSNKSSQNAESSEEFKKFRNNYLLVYLLMMASDWVQGAYVYALYDYYGFSKGEIGLLFVTGFGSSMIFGTIVGSLADKYGRKSSCMLYGILYGASCLTKHFNSFPILMFGRLLGGVATSILYSGFEAWMICQHHKNNFDSSWLSGTFSMAIFGNGFIAILSGIVANFMKDSFGFVAPFDTSLFLLICGTIVIYMTWEENFGNSSIDVSSTINNGYQALFQDRKIILLGLIQSLFEGSMFTFVFMWTPALSADREDAGLALPHGWIFASFMVSVMIGSSLFRVLAAIYPIESFMRYVFLLSTLCLSTPIFIQQEFFLMLSFLVFEMCVGMFWPAVGTMRSKYVPEETRATIMNFFRIPLNGMVVLILYNVGNLSTMQVFSFCGVFMAICLACQQLLYVASLSVPQDK